MPSATRRALPVGAGPESYRERRVPTPTNSLPPHGFALSVSADPQPRSSSCSRSTRRRPRRLHQLRRHQCRSSRRSHNAPSTVRPSSASRRRRSTDPRVDPDLCHARVDQVAAELVVRAVPGCLDHLRLPGHGGQKPACTGETLSSDERAWAVGTSWAAEVLGRVREAVDRAAPTAPRCSRRRAAAARPKPTPAPAETGGSDVAALQRRNDEPVVLGVQGRIVDAAPITAA